jgi:hypothetical protein
MSIQNFGENRGQTVAVGMNSRRNVASRLPEARALPRSHAPEAPCAPRCLEVSTRPVPRLHSRRTALPDGQATSCGQCRPWRRDASLEWTSTNKRGGSHLAHAGPLHRPEPLRRRCPLDSLAEWPSRSCLTPHYHPKPSLRSCWSNAAPHPQGLQSKQPALFRVIFVNQGRICES